MTMASRMPGVVVEGLSSFEQHDASAINSSVVCSAGGVSVSMLERASYIRPAVSSSRRPIRPRSRMGSQAWLSVASANFVHTLQSEILGHI